MNIKIVVATHKKYEMPSDSTLYVPIQVGKAEGIPYLRDNSGDNISSKNHQYSELTALYWAWKNLDYDVLGLVHYRRHFLDSKKGKTINSVISKNKIEKILTEYDIIVPKKRKYYIETLYSHYKNTLHIEPLDITGEIIKEKYSEYYEGFERLKKVRSGYMFNMFIMRKELVDDYLTWLFSVLFDLDKRTESLNYDSFHARYPGRVSELLFNVWLFKNNKKCYESKVIFLEKEHKIKKILSVIKSKIFKTKYKGSF